MVADLEAELVEEIKVLIVDDELLAIEYLKGMISWKDHGYRIVAEATDARHALECFRERRPRIVISDIYMPGVNGLEFCQNILSIDKSVKIILLTAYKEFEYAKKAIELGVSNYLLKHELSARTLLAELEKIRSELENERSANRIIEKHLIMNCMEENEEVENDIGGRWEFLENKNGMFLLLTLKMDRPYPVFAESMITPNFDMSENLSKLYEDKPNDFKFIDSFKLRNQMWALLFTFDGRLSEAVLWNKFYPVALNIQDIFYRVSGFSFSATVETEKQIIRNITRMYRSSLETMEHTPFFGKSKVLLKKDIPIADGNRYTENQVDQAVSLISGALNGLDLQQLRSGIEKLFMDVVAPSFQPGLLRRTCDELIRLINKWRENNFLPPIQDEPDGIQVKLDNCYTIPELMNAFRSAYEQSIESVMDKRYNQYSKKVQKAIQYIHDHYSSDISILDVAEAVKISDSNLSRTFKHETGQSLLEYLTAIRIEKAKKLLQDGNLKIYEISELVGYKTSQYFSQVFFKMTGIQPQDFRGRKK